LDGESDITLKRNMNILVTGSAGHLGEALMRTLRGGAHEAVGLDVLSSPFTDAVGSIVDRDLVRQTMRGVDAVLHAATLHKPHVATHPRQAFIDVNLTGTLNLLEEAVAAGVGAFVFTSTTSAFGRALSPPPGEPAAWLTEDVVPVPKNIYGVTKVAAENLCELSHRDTGMPCIVLRTSRFFPEEDDVKAVRDAREDANNKVNELLYRRVDVEDVVDAHLLALDKARSIGFARYIISATTPFTRADLRDLRMHAPAVLRRHVPMYEAEYARRGWTMFEGIDRVYDNARARSELDWQPRHDFASAIERLRRNEDFRSALAHRIGSKGYHREA
jgi:UDP-glucose 4-epimerase